MAGYRACCTAHHCTVSDRRCLFGFTLSYDEFARTLLTSGSYNTLPLEIFGMTTNVTTPVLFALGTLTTVFSLIVILVFLMVVWFVNRRRNLKVRTRVRV